MVKKMRKCICVLLAIMLFAGCFGVNVNASEATTFATGKFTVTVQAGKEERAKTSFPLESGEIVTINATYSPLDADVDFGLVDSQGTFYYFNVTDGSVDKTIQVEESGDYTLQIRNNSNVEVKVSGFVNY